MSVGMTLWQLHYDSVQPGRWNDMWLQFEKYDELTTPLGKGSWHEVDDKLIIKFPWDDEPQIVKVGMNAGFLLTTFQPGTLLQHIIKREQNAPPWGYMMMWNLLRREPRPFDIDPNYKIDQSERTKLQPKLDRIGFKFELLMFALQSAAASVSATEQKWFITKHSFTNQEILKQLVELQNKTADGLLKIVDELASAAPSHDDLIGLILDKLKNTFAFHTIKIRQAAYIRDPKLGDQIDAGALLSVAGSVAKLFAK